MEQLSNIRKKMILNRENTLLLVIDVQEKLSSVMTTELMLSMEETLCTLIEGCKVLDIPIIVTEQYPKGLGDTLESIKDVLPDDVQPIAKTHFSCCDAPDIMAMIEKTGRKQLILTGMETHICLFQTARDLLERGYDIFVPLDAVISRFEDNLDVGLDLIDKAGATITSMETILFDLLKKAGSPEFKAISKLIK